MQAYAVIGGGYGDEGKGLITDYLVRKTQAQLVVRANGGAQAGHTVNTTDGRRHVFRHVGAGALAGARTFLSDDFIANPLVLGEEIQQLTALGAAPKIHCSPAAKVTTIFDMAINAVAEMHRRDSRHGSCGLGINETVTRHHRGFALTAGMLQNLNQSMVVQLITEIHRDWVNQRLTELGISDTSCYPEIHAILTDFDDELHTRKLMRDLHYLDLSPPPVQTAPVIFEGAQGLALDQDLGVFPHVTRSHTGLPNVLSAAASLGITDITPVYVTRCYSTRHGAGALMHSGVKFTDHEIQDHTNVHNQWQGSLRFAPLNIPLIRDLINRDLARCQGQSPDITINPARLALTCLDQLANDVIIIRQGDELQATQSANLAAILEHELDMPVALLSFGTTASMVVPTMDL